MTLQRVPAVSGARGPQFLALAVAAITALVALAGCAGSTGSAPSASAAGGITIDAAWVQVSGGAELAAAGYLTIENHGPAADALVSASSPAAASVELHETSMDSSGMTGMMPVARLDCPVGATVSLAPGGYHLMIMGLTRALKAGDRLELDLVFEHAGRVAVQAEVRQA